MIKLVESGIVYRNPFPNLRAVHAWHPSIVSFGDGELAATFDLGQAPESYDYATYVSRSLDGGKTWEDVRRLLAAHQAKEMPHTVRVSRIGDRLIGFGALFHRHNHNSGLVNPKNLGYVPTDLFTIESRDRGRTWSDPKKIEPPLVGPSFEVCHPIRELADGRWLAPTSTWKGWDGAAPNGMNAVALVSKDRGRSWPEYLSVIDGYDQGVIHWEQSLVELADKRLLAVAWAYEEASGRTLPTPYAISGDGKVFSKPRPTGLRGQTAKIIKLQDGRILCLYRRHDQPGLWACLARLDGDSWTTLEQAALWQGAASGMEGKKPGGTELSALKFGYPSMVERANGEVFAVFWCSEDCIGNIRWLRLRVI